MKATRIKAEALAWLRYGKRLPVVCTEAGAWNADVLGVSKTMSIEVETKISRADLRAEFKNKRQKHFLYLNTDGNLKSVPNYMYFMVPDALRADALEIVSEGNPKAGVAIYMDTNLLSGQNVVIAKPPQRLHDAKPGVKLIRTAIMRMSSELCGIHLVNEKLRRHIEDSLDKMISASVAASFRAAGSLDVEDPKRNLDLRSAELAFAVDGLRWEDLGEDQQIRWRLAATKLLDIQEPTMEEWNDASKFL